jgi:flagellar hook-length control protein FliK
LPTPPKKFETEGGDILNPIILITPGSTATVNPSASKTPLSSSTGGALFQAQLGDSVAALFAGKTAASSTAGATATVDAELERAVKDQLDRGTSLRDLMTRLASSLATSVAAQLGISPQAAQEQLTQAFTQALQPNDTGPPLTNAERASSLVARFRQIAELATRVTNGDTGQPIRLIAGQRSDAIAAKATPAPQPDSILRDALAALAAPASPALDATTVAPPVPVAPATASDGRTVALSAPVQAIATGGDTPLGRILTRAVLAGDEPTTPVAVPIAGPGNSHLGILPPNVVQTAPADAKTATGAAAPPANPAVLDAFVQAFASALARTDAPAASNSRSGDTTSSDTTNAVAVSGPSGTQSALSFAIPFDVLSLSKDAVPVAPPTPAPTMPQPQHVDANAVADQILRAMTIRTTDGQSEVRLRLVPEQLGDVSVKLIVSGGSVDASIVAHTADAQNALVGGQTQLAKAFADAGLKLQSFTVGLAGGAFADARDQSRQNDSWTHSGSRRFGGVSSVEVDASADASLLASSSFGPPIYSARSLPGNLNILA